MSLPPSHPFQRRMQRVKSRSSRILRCWRPLLGVDRCVSSRRHGPTFKTWFLVVGRMVKHIDPGLLRHTSESRQANFSLVKMVMPIAGNDGPMGPGPLGPSALAHWAHGPWAIGPMGPGPVGAWALAPWALGTWGLGGGKNSGVS